MIFTRIILFFLASVEPDVAYNAGGIEFVTAHLRNLQGGRKWRRTYAPAGVLVGSGLLVANRYWKGGKSGQSSLITAVPAKREDGSNALAIYDPHRMSLIPFKDYSDAHFPIPSAKDLFSLQFLLLDPRPADPDAPAASTCDALGNRAYLSCAGILKAYVRDYSHTPPLLKSS